MNPSRDAELVAESPNGVWTISIRGPSPSSDCFGATFEGKGYSMGVPFGFEAPVAALELRWDLPDSVLGVFIQDRCYLLFRWGPSRRRHRAHFRVGAGNAFTPEEVAWVCSRDHSDAEARRRFHHV